MAQQQLPYVTVNENDFGGGIDAASAENATPETYVEECVNAIPTYDGTLKKRKGYVTYAGGIPFRVTRIETLGTPGVPATYRLKIYFADGVNLVSVRDMPLLMIGRTSTTGFGDFTSLSTASVYYTTSDSDPRKTIAASATTAVSVLAAESGLTSSNCLVQFTESTSLSENDNEQVFVGATVNAATYEVTASVVNGTTSTKYMFVQVLDTATTSLNTYTATGLTGTTWTVLESTHGLPNNNLILRCYNSSGEEIVPGTITISNSGDVVATFSTSQTGKMVLVSCETTNFTFGVSNVGGVPTSISITGLTTPWIFCDCYLDDGSGNRERVLPDSVIVDASTSSATVSITDSGLTPRTFYIFWTCVTVGAPIALLPVTSAGFTPGLTDTAPELCVYGLDHETSYINAGSKAGWVQGLDHYSTQADSHVVCALGWNVFKTSTDATTLKLPTHYPNMRAKTKTADQTVGPAFVSAARAVPRTRGEVIFPEATSAGYATASAFSYDAAVGGGTHKVVITATGVATTGTPIVGDAYFRDYLTITQAPYSELIGSFPIRQVTYGTNTVSIWFEASTASTPLLSSDFDVSSISLTCGVFSDVMYFQGYAYLLPDDILESAIFSHSETPTVKAHETFTTNSKIWLDGFTNAVTAPSGLLMAWKRPAARIVQLRTSTDNEVTDTLFNIVMGDSLAITGYTREFRCVFASPHALQTATFVGTGTEATLTIADAGDIQVGMVIPVYASKFAGTYTVTQVVDGVSFKVSTTKTGTDTVYIGGQVVQFDEAVPNLADTTNNATTVTVPRRWLCVEAPVNGTLSATPTYTKHFPSQDYDEQLPIRSTMSGDNVYFLNGTDDVLKYDGTNVMRAGLWRWPAHLFISTNTGASAEIYVPGASASVVAAVGGGAFSTAAGAASFLQVGDTITNGTGTYWKVTSITSSVSSGTTDRDIVGVDAAPPSTGTVYKVYTYRYYVRLNYIDANNNVIASATTGYDDMYLRVIASFQTTIRLIALPLFDKADGSKIEIEVYRTKNTGVAPFYRVNNISADTSTVGKYIDIVDYVSDEVLTDRDLDKTIAAVGKGANTAPNLLAPPVAKYITSVNNRLVLGNISSMPMMTLKFLPGYSATAFSSMEFIFRKDGTSSATTTDMINTVVYFTKTAASALTLTNVVPYTANTIKITTSTPPGLNVGDWVYLCRIATATTVNNRFAGWFQVKQTGLSPNYTTLLSGLASSVSAAAYDAASDVDSIVLATDQKDVPVYVGTDYSYGDFFGNTSSGIPLQSIVARRLANAINASMRIVDTSQTAFSTFKPWLLAGSGGDYSSGEIQISTPAYSSTTAECRLPTSFSSDTNFRVYGNGVSRSSTETVGFLTYRYPSRCVMSPKNYPEMFDNPFATEDFLSDSVLDINPDDGQTITGVIPMFGSSAFQLSQKAGYLIVFKERSIYVVNTDEKSAGRPYLQRLETSGVGCTLPYSITESKDGIIFANESGIYRLNSELQVELLSYKLSRFYTERTGLTSGQLTLPQGHNSPRNQQYILSFPLGSTATANSEAWVYNYRRESKPYNFTTQMKMGSWAEYTNIPATVWCNKGTDEFFGSTKGRVFKLRAAGDNTDFRDDDEAISFQVQFRNMDFGDAGIRKQCKHFFISFRNQETAVTGTNIYTSINLAKNDWYAAQSFTQRLSSARSVDSLRFSAATGRFLHLQLKAENSTIDMPVEISGITYRVIGLSDMRTKEAKGD